PPRSPAPPPRLRIFRRCPRRSKPRRFGCWRGYCGSTSTTGSPPARCGRRVMGDKLTPHHPARKAILYIRQSSAHQVQQNLESQRLQYAMRDRLQQLGWREIEVVDDDLGRPAAGLVTRAGFARMVADICLGQVGAVAAREVSRFARNSREWQQLVEVCRVVDTVLIDLDTVYSPRHSNDRLLLGLKGSLNEYELDLLRQRSVEAPGAKARRGARRVSQNRRAASRERSRSSRPRGDHLGVSEVWRAGHRATDALVVSRA